MNNKIDILIKLFITFFLLFFLVFKIGLKNIYQTFLNLDPIYMVIFIVMFFIIFILGTINIAILLLPLKHNLKFSNIFKYYSLSWAMGLLTPARVGEFSIVYYLNRHKIPLGSGMAVALLDKLITMGIYLIIGFFGIILFFYIENMYIFLLLALLLFIFILFIFLSEMGRNLIKNILKQHATKFKGFSKTINIFIKKRLDLLFYNIIFTIIKTVLMALATYWLFLGFKVHVPFWLVLVTYVLGSIVSFIPISISGLGVRESVVIVLYAKFGIPASVVFSNYLFTNALNYFFALFLIVLNFYDYDRNRKYKKINLR